MQHSRGGQRTWQPPSNDQRVYQSHPARRAAAEPCQQLHPTRLGVGEVPAPKWVERLASMRPAPASVPLAAGGAAALEAAHVLAERHTAMASFLLRKVGEAAAGTSYFEGRKHPRAGGRDWEQQGRAAGGGIGWVGRRPPPYARPNQQHRWPSRRSFMDISEDADGEDRGCVPIRRYLIGASH